MVKKTRVKRRFGALNETYAEVYSLVRTYMKEHPGSNAMEAARELGLNAKVFYAADRRRKVLSKRKREAAFSGSPVRMNTPEPRAAKKTLKLPLSPEGLFDFLLSSMQAEAKLSLALSIIRGER